jgi:SAM-dependent methyltransferase
MSDNKLSKPSQEAPPAEEPDVIDYADRLESEKAFHKEYLNISDLPEIFAYWSNKYLVPMFAPFGFTSPNGFFVEQIREYAQRHADRSVRIISIGAGNCDVEAAIAGELVEMGVANFKIECLDINQDMLSRGVGLAEDKGLVMHLHPLIGDFNEWTPIGTYDIVMANQSLHHVLNLEGLFDSVAAALKPGGRFLVSDMIGRNGHQRWPEAMEALAPFWQRLPPEYRYNQLLQRYKEDYINHDCSTVGFEGIRAQNILPLLRERFNFELFIPFANIIMVFIDRPFGHNFDAEAEWDRNFIDELHAADQAAILSGELTPTQMLAVLCTDEAEPRLLKPHLTPEFCTREP